MSRWPLSISCFQHRQAGAHQLSLGTNGISQRHGCCSADVERESKPCAAYTFTAKRSRRALDCDLTLVGVAMPLASSAMASCSSGATSVRTAASRARPIALDAIRNQRHQRLPPSWLFASQQHVCFGMIRVSSAKEAHRNFTCSSMHCARLRSSVTPSSTASSSRSHTHHFAFPTHLANPTPYDIFHFRSRCVSPAEIKSRYYDLVRCCHPDRYSSCSSRSTRAGKTKTQAEDEFKRVVSAYALLKDARAKQLYDRAGIGWASAASSSSDGWRTFQDVRYTRRYNPSFTGAGHDRFGWQHQGFYSNQYTERTSFGSGSGSGSSSAGWNGGNGQYTSNGMLISTLFVLTWVLAGLQYSRLSLQSAKAVERADRSHLDAARSLNDAREAARSAEGRQRRQAFRRRVREQKLLDELQALTECDSDPSLPPHASHAKQATDADSAYRVGHSAPSGKAPAQQRSAKAAQTA